MSELMKVDGMKFSQSFESASISLWCVPCGFTHTFDPEQVEMVVYALAVRLRQMNNDRSYLNDPIVEPEWLTGNGSQDCLLGHLEQTGTETQAVVLRNVQRREAE